MSSSALPSCENWRRFSKRGASHCASSSVSWYARFLFMLRCAFCKSVLVRFFSFSWLTSMVDPARCGGCCAIRPAMIPVSTSPVPPLATAGLPEEFTQTRPLGCAISVRCPLSTTMAPRSWAKRRAIPMRSLCTSAAVEPSNRAISPG